MNNNVGHVMTDYLGNLWFTSTRQDVMKVVPNQFSDLFERFGLPETVVNTTCMHDNMLFVGTDTGLLVLDENGTVPVLPAVLSGAGTDFSDKLGDYAVSGTDTGAFDLIGLLEGSRIRSIIRDSRDRLWISTWRSDGLLRYDHGEVTFFTDEDGLLSTSLRSVCEREDGSILVALTGGVSIIQGDKVTASYGKEDGIVNTESLTVAEGPGGDIVLGSNGGGIYVISGSGVSNIDVEQGLPSDIVMRLKRDTERNVIWIVTSSAIAYMTPDYKVTTVRKFPYPVNRSDMVSLDYTNLRGGTYRYIMQLRDSMGRGDRSVSVTIVKEKAYYEETWFYGVVSLIALALLAAFVKLYVRRKTRIFEKKQQEAYEQFEQTAEALASAIDAKDTYTNGHSRRVAEYSKRIATEAGKSEDECERVYFAALLHDVGKIGVPIEILSKKGRLTDEEFEQIKRHPVVGGQILSSIRKSPWLSIGARFHHERYNGRGYPEGLSGADIPEIARIIAVADAYDAMTSNRSYRSAIPQHIVREEIVKGIGTQFDPEFAKVMLHMIDLDTEYRMQESESGASLAPTTSLRCDTIYHDCTEGVVITKKPTHIRLYSQPDEGVPDDKCLPTLILFDSLDSQVHPGEENNKDLLYFEYARIRLDGHITEWRPRTRGSRYGASRPSATAQRTYMSPLPATSARSPTSVSPAENKKSGLAAAVRMI